MGPNKKGYNWKARQVVETKVIQTEEVQVEIDGGAQHKYDQSNAFVLPSAKRKTKIVKEKHNNQRILSKRQRKKLEKIVETKKKKANRAGLLEALAQVQVSAKELGMMTSLISVQTKGLKRSINEMESETQLATVDETGAPRKMNSIAGSKKRQRQQQTEEEEKVDDDCNVIGLEVEDDSSSDSEDSQEPEEEETAEIDDDKKTETESESKKESPVEEKAENAPANDAKTVVEEKNQTPVPKTVVSKPAVFVPVYRTAEIQAARLKLPITAEEQSIVEAINENDVVILAGETGSGKTTQVPQFLYEAGYAAQGKMIAVTEPRRVAATSMANRVAHEMNLHDGQVAYQIRFEGNAGDATRIKFMTDGVLLKEVQKDFLLQNYSVVIIDEAHERSVYSDILLGLLSRIVKSRKKKGNPLKLVIMSATMRVEDFTKNVRLFKDAPPVIQVEARQFPVTVHFNKRTVFEDYVYGAYRKVCKIHRQLPDGGILVFLTGQQEVNALCRKLRHTFPAIRAETKVKKEPSGAAGTSQSAPAVFDEGGPWHDSDLDEDMEKVMTKIKKKQFGMKKHNKDVVITGPKVNLDRYSALPLQDEEQEDDVDVDLGDLDSERGSGDSDDEDEEIRALSNSQLSQPLWVLPLYSLLPSARQQKVFDPPPEGSRLCVVATNVAETSLTIPGIRYVVDTGRVKTKFYDKVTGVSAFHVTWTSQAAANQRAGRAGRTGPGHCYRLYSSAIFNDEFEKFSVPDIKRRPIDDLVLQMKAMDILKVVNFPFPTPPEPEQLAAAEKRLILLGALEPLDRNIRLNQMKLKEWTSKITALGRAMAAYPLAPRYAKMLLFSQQHRDLFQLTIALVSALSVQELLLDHPVDNAPRGGEMQKKWADQRRSWAGEVVVKGFHHPSLPPPYLLGDAMVLLKAVVAAEEAGATEEFCRSHGVRSKALHEVRKLRVQLTNETNVILGEAASVAVDPKMAPPTDVQVKWLRQILLAGLPDRVARRVAVEDIKEAEDKRKLKHAYRCPDMVGDLAFVHPSSVLRHSRPEWIVYQDIYEIQGKIYLRGITAIDPTWLPVYCPSQCTLTRDTTREPRYDAERGQVLCHMKVTFGSKAWEVPPTELEFPAGEERFKYFAQFLLAGSVCPPLKKYINDLISTPSTMTKNWAQLQPRTVKLLADLKRNRVDSLESLLNAWRSDPLYLLSSYKQWLPISLHDKVTTEWPPV